MMGPNTYYHIDGIQFAAKMLHDRGDMIFERFV